ncbi:MAG: glycosyltransferase [Candidatus Omnitrophota bacterium]
MRDAGARITVAHLVPGIPYGGGAENLLLDICRFTDKNRFNVVVFYWTNEAGLAEDMRLAGAQVVRLSWKKVLSWQAFDCLHRALKEYRVDLLHTHFIDSDLLGVCAANAVGIPVVSHVHSFPFPQNIRQALRYRLMSPFMKKIIPVSKAVQACVASRTGIGAQKFRVIPNGADLARFSFRVSVADQAGLRSRWGVEPGDVLVGTVTRFEADKSVDTLLRSVPLMLVRYPKIKVMIVGYGFLEKPLRALCESLGLAGRVIFTGRQVDVPLYLSVMDVFVLTAVEEAFGLSLLEAMAAGKPVVAADAGALPDLASGGCGLLFKPRDPGSLADTVLRLLDNPALAKELSISGRQRAGAFSAQAMTEHLQALYTEVMIHG